MSLFSRKKRTDLPAEAGKVEKVEKKGSTASSAPDISNIHVASHVLRNPRITEKGTMHAEQSTYLFDVAPNATKHEIAQAIRAVYKVMPRMIRVVTIPAKRKQNQRTGKGGVSQGGKKAYVYLKKGETITIT